MQNKKERSAAQKAADARYNEKIKERIRVLGFSLRKDEADKIEVTIAESGMTKVDFLRRAVQLYKEGKF